MRTNIVTAPELHPIAVSDATWHTDLPVEIPVMSPPVAPQAGEQLANLINPLALDQLPLGTYTLRSPEGTDRYLTIAQYGIGKIASGLVRERVWLAIERTDISAPLLQPFGFAITDEDRFNVTREGVIVPKGHEDGSRLEHFSGIPTPETFKAASAEVGVQVRLLPGGKQLATPYLSAYRDGEYPTATGSMYYYGHDIDDDHITALFLGGNLLQDNLAGSAEHGLAATDPNIAKFNVIDIDNYTARLRRAVARAPLDTVADRHLITNEHRVDELVTTGERIGITPRTTRKILRHALDHAHDLGIPVREYASRRLTVKVRSKE